LSFQVVIPNKTLLFLHANPSCDEEMDRLIQTRVSSLRFVILDVIWVVMNLDVTLDLFHLKL